MLINYKDADGKIIKLEVSEELGNFYLESLEKEKSNQRRETRRHTSLETFTYEDKRFFSNNTELPSDLADLSDLSGSETFGQAMAHLTKRQQYLIRKVCIEGFTCTKLAATEGVSKQAIAKSLNTAKIKLRKFLIENL
ncbi:MAG: hypothetical protein LBK29_02535 [Oscillospiraceae bacterium]|jgi:RNA polymerase sigma-70 factor (ECF subfamily)|nr:hypothetical protein [Oscillospiraceae bacterium]